jgi:hypothetical protein
MKKWFNNNWLYIIGATLGAVGGYVYWMQIGCTSGTCAITSKPLNSSIYGALLGALALGMFKKDKRINTTKEPK